MRTLGRWGGALVAITAVCCDGADPAQPSSRAPDAGVGRDAVANGGGPDAAPRDTGARDGDPGDAEPADAGGEASRCFEHDGESELALTLASPTAVTLELRYDGAPPPPATAGARGSMEAIG